MIATISFTTMAEWVIGAFLVGCFTGFAVTSYLFLSDPRKKSK